MLLKRAAATLAVSFWSVCGTPPVFSHGAAPPRPNTGRSTGISGPATIGRDPALSIEMRPRESLRTALVRAGVGIEEANRAADALADDFDTVNPHPGLGLSLTVSHSPGAPAPRLVSLELTPRENDHLGLWRDVDGTLRLRRVESPVFSAPSLTRGVVHGSLYLSIVEAGVTPETAAKVTGLFGRRLDLTRDIESGDRFRLVFDRGRNGGGAATEAQDLLYAEVSTNAGDARLYRFQPEGAREPRWVDGAAGPTATGLLRTPVDGAHLTSSFGLRLHPLLGFTRMHEGVDFGASLGAPVLAAGDGVIEEARWAGGYGRWLKIRHSADLETGYGHLSAWGAGVVPGARVRQGQIVAFVGASGLATGPHLHYEVFEEGRRIDPRAAPMLSLASRDPARDPDFRARKADIDAAVSALSAACAVPSLFLNSPAARCIG